MHGARDLPPHPDHVRLLLEREVEIAHKVLHSRHGGDLAVLNVDTGRILILIEETMRDELARMGVSEPTALAIQRLTGEMRFIAVFAMAIERTADGAILTFGEFASGEEGKPIRAHGYFLPYSPLGERPQIRWSEMLTLARLLKAGSVTPRD